MPVATPTIDDVVEKLCNEGCQAVHLYIQQLEQNNPVELLNGLSNKDKEKILHELRAIMAVYDRCQ